MKQRLKNVLHKIKNLSFYKKKPFYIVLVVLFSLMLVADIGIRIFVPEQNNSFGNMQNFDRGDMSSFGENADSEDSNDSSSSEDTDTDASSSEENANPDNANSGDATDSDSGMNGRGNGGGRGGMGKFDSDSSDVSSDNDSSDMPSMDGDMPSGDMPSFDENSDSSADTDSSDTDSDSDTVSSDTDSDNDMSSGDIPSMNGNFDFSEIQQEIEEASEENTNFLQKIKSHWLLIFIILLVLDGASIFMLAWISHKEKKVRVALEEEIKRQQAEGEVHLVRPEKKKKHSHLFWIIPVVGVILLVLVVKMFSGNSSTEASETEATVYSETAELSDISTVLPGAGTLTEETAEELTLASDVEISSWYVSNGDTVEEGDKLAEVDKVSVMTAIVSVQEMITALDEELAEHEDEEIDDEITTSADGRVMAIYASEDDSIVDVMYENSALMLISLDGNLAVDIETDADISVGDSVDVTLSDDTVITGKVDSIISGTAVILVSDEDTSLDEEVSVASEDGTSLGSGTLYIHSQLKITGFTGTVDDIEVSVGDEVDAGDTLITLDDTEYTGDYDSLMVQRNELEEEMQELFQLYQDGCIYASYSGVVSGIDSSSTTDDTDSETDADTTDGETDADTTDDDGDGETDSNNTDGDNESDSDSKDSEASLNADSSVSQMSTRDTSSASNSGVVATIMTTTVTDKTSTSTGVTSAAVSNSNTSGVTKVSTNNITSTATLADTSSDYVNYIGMVTAVTDNTVEMKLLPNTYTVADYSDLSSLTIDEAAMTETATFDISTFKVVFNSESGKLSLGSANDISTGDNLILAYDADDTSSLTFVVKVVETTETTEPTEPAESTETTETTETTESSSEENNSNSSEKNQGENSQMPDSTDTENGDTTDTENSMGDGTGNDTSSENPDTDTTGENLTGQTGDNKGSTDASQSSVTVSSGNTTDTDATAETEEVETSYSIDETTVLSITPQDTMTITITVDELDILSLEEGLDALVTLDAFPGQSFEGEVTNIDTSGTNSGGSTKFTAEVTISREEDMLVGMNASVVITLDTKENVLSVPEAALVEEGNSVYVYTSYDEKTETLGDLVEVTTGVSDGENVEILSGLDEGSEFYYSYLDVVNYSSQTSSSTASTFSMDSIFGGNSGNNGRR